MVGSLSIFLSEQKRAHWVFDLENLKTFLLHIYWTCQRSIRIDVLSRGCICIWAPSITRLLNLMMLLIFPLKNVTAKILPCGIPFSWLWRSEKVDPTQSLKFLSKRRLLKKTGRLRLCRYLMTLLPCFFKIEKVAVRCFFFFLYISS